MKPKLIMETAKTTKKSQTQTNSITFTMKTEELNSWLK